MADNILNASTNVDLTGVRSLKAELAVLQEQYRAVSGDIRQSVNRVVDAEKQATEAIAAGHTQLAASLQSAANSERAALDGLISKQLEVKAALDGISTSSTRAVTEIQAVSGTLRTLDGNGGIRAAERFLTQIPLLAPALQAAFPVVGLIALGEVVERAYKHFTGLSEEEKHAAEESKQFNAEIRRSTQELESLDVQLARIQSGSLAAAKQAVDNATADLRRAEQDARDATEKAQGGSIATDASGRQYNAPPHPYSDTATPEVQAAVKAGEEMAKAEKKLNIALAEVQKAQEEEDKRHASAVKQAAEQLVANLRKADEDELEDLELSGSLTLQSKQKWIQQKLAAESNYADRVRELKRQLVTVENEEASQNKRVAEQENESWDKLLETIKHNGTELERVQKESITQQLDEEKEIEKQIDLRKQLLEIQREGGAKLAEVSKRGAGAAEELEIEHEKLEVQRQEATTINATSQDRIRWATQIAEIDRKNIETKIKTTEAELQVAQAALLVKTAEEQGLAPSEKKVQALKEEMKLREQIATLQNTLAAQDQSLRNKEYADETAKLKAIQQQYQQYFNTIQQGFIKSATDAIEQNRRWQQDLVSILGSLIQQFIALAIKRVVTWVEGTTAIHAAEAVLASVLQALHITSAATAKATQTTSAAAEITSDAAVGAAGAAAAVAPIPFVGPALAPEAAAATEALILGFLPQAALETGTNYVPTTGNYTLHRGEAVIPKEYNPAAGGTAPGNTYNVTQHIHGGPQHSPEEIAQMAVTKFQSLMRRQNRFAA